MTLAFVLTMPGCPSWNGRWSGQEQLHASILKIGEKKARRILEAQPYYHRWSDGWTARIEVKEVAGVEIRKMRKASKGFCGYEWMIQNICLHGTTY